MEIIEGVGEVLWGPWTPWTLLAAGLLFTVWSRFTQFTVMTHGFQVVRGVYDDPDDPGAINHFQALSAALSATVGLGNIGGVALAIGVGGPGALFWMWIVGVFGMALKTIEITLAMMYRNTDDPENPHGGAMWVVEKVVGAKGGAWQPIARAIGVFFCITLIVSTFTGGNMFQSWSVANLTESYFQVPKVGTGVVMAVIVGLVIVGGIKRIGHVAGRLVPLMCILYVLAALAVLAMHVGEIPSMLALIVKSAFQPSEATGAFLGGSMGWAFIQGMKRALFSNEAGQGSAPIAHAAAKTDEPAREGIVGGIGPFIDTLCICTITALVIIATGTWNRDAVGEFQGPVALSSEGDAWSVQASSDTSQLPEDKYGKWASGSTFYLVGKIEGATQRDSTSRRVKFLGTVVQPEGGEGAANRYIEWSSVTIDPADWEGDSSAVALESKDVFRDYAGAELTGHAFDRQFFGLGRWLVTSSAWLFAISTMISWSYYGEQGMIYMLGEKSVLPYKVVFLISVIYAANWIDGTEHMMVLMDIGTGAMLWSNVPIVLCLGFLAIRCLDDYKKNLRAGKFKRHAAPPITDVVDGKDVE